MAPTFKGGIRQFKRNMPLPISIDEALAIRLIREANAQGKYRDRLLEEILAEWFADKPERED